VVPSPQVSPPNRARTSPPLSHSTVHLIRLHLITRTQFHISCYPSLPILPVILLPIATTKTKPTKRTKTIASKITAVPVRFTEDSAGPRLVKVAQNYPDILFFQFVHGRSHLVGKTLGFFNFKASCFEISHEAIVRLKQRPHNITALLVAIVRLKQRPHNITALILAIVRLKQRPHNITALILAIVRLKQRPHTSQH